MSTARWLLLAALIASASAPTNAVAQRGSDPDPDPDTDTGSDPDPDPDTDSDTDSDTDTDTDTDSDSGLLEWDDEGGGGSPPAADPDEEEAEEEEEPDVEEEREVEPTEAEADGDAEEDDGALGGSTIRLAPIEPEAREGDSTLILPPIFTHVWRGRTRTTALFPLFFNRSDPEDEQLLILLYYYRRGLELNADVLFPLFWSFRGVDSLTFSIPPFYFHSDPAGPELGLAPLFFYGKNEHDEYAVIPPLLSFTYADEDEAYTIASLFWRIRSGESVDYGLFPLLWSFSDGSERDTFFPPLFFRFTDEDEDRALTIVPPVYHEETEDHALYGAAPIFHHYHDRETTSLTLPPLLTHYSRSRDSVTLGTPLFLWLEEGNAHTFITWLYQHHRGDRQLDAVAPIFFFARDPRDGSSAVVVPPVFWYFESPVSTTLAVFPLFGLFREEGLYSTVATPLVVHSSRRDRDASVTWVAPTFEVSHDGPNHNTFNLHPLVYWTNTPDYFHRVLAPIWWDFNWEADDYRATVAFPLYFRFRSGPETKQLMLNTYFREYEEDGANGWEFHFFPLFAFGKPRAEDHWWSILYGLAGYRRSGSYGRAQILFIPFQTDGPSAQARNNL